jgi:hypothetical protein
VRLKSRGLGRKELVMDFREYEVIREGDEIVVVGQIRDPVNWDFSIRLCEDDLAGIVRLACNPRMLGLLLRALFRRHKRHHWSQEHAEHIAEGQRRLAEAREKAAARSQAARTPASAPQLPDSGPSALG